MNVHLLSQSVLDRSFGSLQTRNGGGSRRTQLNVVEWQSVVVCKHGERRRECQCCIEGMVKLYSERSIADDRSSSRTTSPRRRAVDVLGQPQNATMFDFSLLSGFFSNRQIRTEPSYSGS
jgi:hypothetical protein